MAAEVNGSPLTAKEEEEPMDISATHADNCQKLVDAGLAQKVAEKLNDIFLTGRACVILLLACGLDIFPGERT